MATPLIFLALAELYSQRAGLVHIGLEGLASIGSLVGFLVSLITGSPLLGVLAGAAVRHTGEHDLRLRYHNPLRGADRVRHGNQHIRPCAGLLYIPGILRRGL